MENTVLNVEREKYFFIDIVAWQSIWLYGAFKKKKKLNLVIFIIYYPINY